MDKISEDLSLVYFWGNLTCLRKRNTVTTTAYSREDTRGGSRNLTSIYHTLSFHRGFDFPFFFHWAVIINIRIYCLTIQTHFSLTGRVNGLLTKDKKKTTRAFTLIQKVNTFDGSPKKKTKTRAFTLIRKVNMFNGSPKKRTR